MIQALAAEAAEEALADRVQVGRPGWDRDHVHIRAGGGRGEVAPELAIGGPDPEPRCAVVRRNLSELLSDPRIGRGAGDVDVWTTSRVLSVSNSLSGRHGELDQVPAVGDLTDIVQLGTGHHVSAGEGQRRDLLVLEARLAGLDASIPALLSR